MSISQHTPEEREKLLKKYLELNEEMSGPLAAKQLGLKYSTVQSWKAKANGKPWKKRVNADTNVIVHNVEQKGPKPYTKQIKSASPAYMIVGSPDQLAEVLSKMK